MLSITGSNIITSPPPYGQTDRCKNTTLPQTSFAGGDNVTHLFKLKIHCNRNGNDCSNIKRISADKPGEIKF